MTDNYDDIINLPRHISKTRPHMSVSDRAAQFAPFAALTGYGDAVKETARLTDTRKELDEYEKAALNERLRIIGDYIYERPQISLTYYKPDDKKTGGAYLTVTGFAKKIDEVEKIVLMTDNTKIPIEEIFAIEGEIIYETLEK